MFDHDVKGARDEFDFSEARDGSSIWCPNKSRAITVQTSFHNWMKLNRTRLRPNIEKVSQADRNGRGFRVYFYETGPADHEDADIEKWANERTKNSIRQPACGWHLTSELYGDYKTWHKDNGSSYALKNITRFSQTLAELPGVRRIRQSAGTVFHGIAFQGEEEFNPYGAKRPEPVTPMHMDLREALKRQDEELRALGWRPSSEKRPATLEELLAREAAREKEANEATPDGEDGEDDGDEDIRACATCSDCLFAELINDDGDCQKCAIKKRLRSE